MQPIRTSRKSTLPLETNPPMTHPRAIPKPMIPARTLVHLSPISRATLPKTFTADGTIPASSQNILETNNAASSGLSLRSNCCMTFGTPREPSSNFNSGVAGGILRTNRDDSVPATAIDTHAVEATQSRSGKYSSRNPATTVPKIIARKVVIRMKPLARGKSTGRSISGRIPYLAGPKKPLWAPMKNSTT